MTPEELAALIDSIPEVAEMARNRATLLDLVTLRPLEELGTIDPDALVIVWRTKDRPSRFSTAWNLAGDPCGDTYAGWTPLPTPLTEGDSDGA
jgi:hypothetical protein